VGASLSPRGLAGLAWFPVGSRWERMNAKNSFIGKIIKAGTDDKGICRIIIEADEIELEKLTYLPLYNPVLITLSKIEIPETKI
jgi:hypothetical protein